MPVRLQGRETEHPLESRWPESRTAAQDAGLAYIRRARNTACLAAQLCQGDKRKSGLSRTKSEASLGSNAVHLCWQQKSDMLRHYLRCNGLRERGKSQLSLPRRCVRRRLVVRPHILASVLPVCEAQRFSAGMAAARDEQAAHENSTSRLFVHVLRRGFELGAVGGMVISPLLMRKRRAEFATFNAYRTATVQRIGTAALYTSAATGASCTCSAARGYQRITCPCVSLSASWHLLHCSTVATVIPCCLTLNTAQQSKLRHNLTAMMPPLDQVYTLTGHLQDSR